MRHAHAVYPTAGLTNCCLGPTLLIQLKPKRNRTKNKGEGGSGRRINLVQYFDRLARLVFALASTFLMLLAFAIIILAGFNIYLEFTSEERDIGSTLLDSIGYTIIAVAVFQVANNFFDTEVIGSRDTDVRGSTSKFVSTISVAILLEALVAVFKASQESLSLMLYPTLLLFGGIALMVGLGVYLYLTKPTEDERSARRGGNPDVASREHTR